MSRAAVIAAVLVAATAAAAASLDAQGVPPNARWRTIRTEHFRVHFIAAEEAPARHAAAEAERAYRRLAARLHIPRGVVELVVADNVDFSNGLTTVFPTNRIVIYSLPPLDVPSLAFYDSWYEEIITHELTHVFHLDRTAGWWGVAQSVFGRAPLLFPNAYEPSWMTEGLAVYFESDLTGAGRLKGSYTPMVVRSAALRRAVPYWDTWSLASTRYPYGNLAYDYGAEFLDALATAHGRGSVRELVERASRRAIPFTYNGAASGAFGASFALAWTRWRDTLDAAARTIASPERPLPGWRDLTREGFSAIRPRWTGDGGLLYAGDLGKSFSAAYVLDAAGARSARGRRNSLDTQVPLADGGVLFAQLEFGDPYHVRSDLYVQHGAAVTRLTRGARLAEPDARRDGAIVCVRYEPATTSLVRVSADGRRITPLTSVSADTEWAEPRWSPDGTRIAATRWTRGAYADVVVLDSLGQLLRTFTHDRASDASPSWTPDGAAVLFTSDRTGATEIYLARVADSAPPRRLSAATTGLFYPSVAPDGRMLAAVRYDADGDHVGVAPLDSAGAGPAPLDSTFLAPASIALPPDSTAAHGYSPFPALWPHYWLPAIGTNSLGGATVGAYTGGSDVIGRHAYFAQALVDPWQHQNAFDAGYAYAGLGQPVLTLSGAQYWDRFAVDSAGLALGTLFRRTRAVDLGVTLRRLRFYSAGSLTFFGGIEQRHYTTDPDSLQGRLPSYYWSDKRFWTLGASAGYSNAATPIAGVSPEDGISAVLATTARWLEGESQVWSNQLQGSLGAFVALGRGSFAHPVLRLRAAAGTATGQTPSAFDLGGVSGGDVMLLPGVVLGSARFFPVRGFPAGVESGTRIMAGTAELRLPLAALHHGLGFFPLFLDRSSVTLFGDAGSAWGLPAAGDAASNAVASVGAELAVFVGVPYDFAYTFRLGVAAPVLNRSALQVPAATFYVTLGGGN